MYSEKFLNACKLNNIEYVSNHYKNQGGKNFIDIAVKYEAFDVFKFLLSKKFSVEHNLISLTIKYGLIDFFIHLYNLGFKSSKCLLKQACDNNCVKIFEFLLDNGYDDKNILHYACVNNRSNIVRVLFRHGYTHGNLLSEACINHNSSIIELLNNINYENKNVILIDTTMILSSLYFSKLIKNKTYKLISPSDFDPRSDNTNNIMDISDFSDDLNFMEYFIENKFINVSNVVDNVCKNGNVEILKYLVSVNKNELEHSLRLLCKYNNIDAVKYVISHKIVKKCDCELLIEQSDENHTEIVIYLFENMIDYIGDKIFDNACKNGNITLVKYFYKYRRNCNIEKSIIFKNDYFEIFKFLYNETNFFGRISKTTLKKYSIDNCSHSSKIYQYLNTLGFFHKIFR